MKKVTFFDSQQNTAVVLFAKVAGQPKNSRKKENAPGMKLQHASTS